MIIENSTFNIQDHEDWFHIDLQDHVEHLANTLGSGRGHWFRKSLLETTFVKR